MNNVKSMFSQVFPWFMSWSQFFAFLEPAWSQGINNQPVTSVNGFWSLMIIFSDDLKKATPENAELPCSYMQMSEYHKFVNKTSEMTWTDEKMIFT